MPPTLPPYRKILWPTLQAVIELGGSGRIDEINAKAIEVGRYSEELQSIPHGDGRQSELEYRIAWGRTLLKWIGALDNSTRGVWSVTDEGRSLGEADVERLYQEQRARELAERRTRRQQDDDPSTENGDNWKDQLLGHVLELSPERFERLARRLLREAGFISVSVTGKSGDGGIDGLGVYRLSLVSFPVFFQCKRYRGSVRAGAVRDFRGAMAGRGDKGLLITTGTFTADAKHEATRDGAPPIDLIDGERLCDLLKEYQLGVRTSIRQVEEVELALGDLDDV